MKILIFRQLSETTFSTSNNYLIFYTDIDALGEYTGVKPDEFVVLDKANLAGEGQIMYDMPAQHAISCSTVDRLQGRRNDSSTQLLTSFKGPTDYNTGM